MLSSLSGGEAFNRQAPEGPAHGRAWSSYLEPPRRAASFNARRIKWRNKREMRSSATGFHEWPQLGLTASGPERTETQGRNQEGGQQAPPEGAASSTEEESEAPPTLPLRLIGLISTHLSGTHSSHPPAIKPDLPFGKDKVNIRWLPPTSTSQSSRLSPPCREASFL